MSVVIRFAADGFRWLCHVSVLCWREQCIMF